MSGALLPHALLDFTLSRASARLETLAYQSLRRNASIQGKRYAHQSVSFTEMASSDYLPLGKDGRSFYSRRQISRQKLSPLESAGLFPYTQDKAVTELEKRIAELKEAPVTEAPEAAEMAPTYSDEELVSMYEDLLAVPLQTQGQVVDLEAQKRADEAIVRRTVHSLYALEDPSAIAIDLKSQYKAAISKLIEMVEALEPLRDPSGALPVEVSLLSDEQWVSLVRVCVEGHDGAAAETVVGLMKRSGSNVPDIALETVMSVYASAGDVPSAERFLATFAGPSPPPALRDLHIKAHLRALAPRTFPTQALSLIHDYESCNLPAPQRTYTRLISSLLSLRSSVGEAQAWDLFAHMRYVAHPTPDAFLYTLMISACASRVIAPQPARALDLFTEMTVDKRIPPTAAAYTAAIYACARSGEKLYVGEAFRLAKEMLDGHRDAYGNPAFRPDRKTFCALLEGAKRTGDLAKVRWILAEIVAECLREGGRGGVAVDEEILTHVFHAYAAYRPPFKRSAVVLVERNGDKPTEAVDGGATVSLEAEARSAEAAPTESEGAPAPQEGEATSTATANVSSQEGEAAPEHPQSPVETETTHFSTLLPQSHAEVLGEAQALFARVLRYVVTPFRQASDDAEHTSEAEDAIAHAFQHVRPTPRLLNAYLSVHYAHALFDAGPHLYRTVFSELGVQRNAWTYIEALERAGRARREERKPALQFAREAWAGWAPVEEAWWRREGANEARVDARLVERAYVAMIRVLSLTGYHREAVRLVRQFVDRYPPSQVSKPNPKHALRSTRILLTAPRPVVRMLSSTEVPDDTVPPSLSFFELEVLHHRLVAVGDRESIGYIKYVCMSYQGALKRRKDAALRAKPVTDPEEQGDE
ncbi:hypothetical protein BD310DRAFT_822029 [Dichomitus squalens]|uniref:Uncharacterized protein n=1 Tax=Dichomitus squalens TaxID=114155 RepID=A0A4Q9PS35_9APHY|nr:hypothetical protein BD310DRAFT_822029 [Dichomitus squalens]